MRRAVALLLVCFALAAPARAFPGVCLGKDGAERVVHSTVVVIMQHAGTAIVTVAADYEGPLGPFALLLPIPSDVVAERIMTLKRGLVARLDEISAPRHHVFYEQDPCDGGRTEQRWDERLPARGRGFLASEGLPPLDKRYAISNEISAPIEPVFKRAENEFRYQKLAFTELAELRAFLLRSGYAVSERTLAALSPHVGKGKALLLAEVSPAHVELANARRVELGGIRYATRQPLTALPITLGLVNAKARQELLLYVFDREQRYEAKNYENRFVPTNLRVSPRASEQMARVYDALLEAAAPASRPVAVTEYAWSTRGCGEPCADAPLGLDELMSFGGDVLEARAMSDKARAGEPAIEQERDRERFEQQLAALPAQARARERREHARVLAELGRRRALMARQTYVLSRLHLRYDATAPVADLELRPSAAMRGGVGVPAGRAGELPREAKAAVENALQVRLVSLEPWTSGTPCASPERHRWGKPWASEARASRAVPLATRTLSAPGDRKFLLGLLEGPVPELGIDRRELRHAAPAAPLPSASAAASVPARSGGCSLARRGRSRARESAAVLGLFVLGLSACLRRVRRPLPARPRR
jgi:hypothetical protein